jgi:iron complex outermembrane receptor protein
MRTTALLAAFAAAPAVLLAQTRSDTSRAHRDTARTLEAVTISAIRARDDAPVSAKNITTAEIEARSFGQDLPLLLQGTPSLTSYSETGNYWGYSYVRMRGIDQSRINLTLDGIPLNDPEDQVLYFADFPDLANSIGSVQVQRGVGTSAPGTASYGGSINFQTIPVATARRAGQLQLQGGSFGTARASAEYATGLLPSRLAVYGRLSALQSTGYRRHSGMEGRSGFLSAAYVGERDIVKFTALAGLFADTLSYLGATRTELALDRRLNPLRSDEVDRFGEQVAALSYTRYLGRSSSTTATLYRISAAGNYDVCISACDQPQGELWNFHLDFAWYGATTAWTFESDRVRASVGANANTYARDHYAYARPDLSRSLYFNTGHKDDASAFAKLAYDAGRVTVFADVQGRRAEFRYAPDPNAGIGPSSIDWTFLNPKIGVTLPMTPAVSGYASYGVNSREPARSDMLAGFDNLDTSNAAFVGPLSRVRPERVHDAETGLRYRGRAWSVDANAFAMAFRNEILPVGRLSYIGTPLRTNVRASWRRGVELDLTAQLLEAVRLGLTATAMRARIADFTDDETGQAYRDVAPLLTPSFTSSQRVAFDLTRTLSLTLTGRYSSRAQLTNTGDRAFTLPAYYTADLSADWKSGAHGLALYVNNATNSRRYASGHVSFGEARYYVLPPLNVFLLARIGT